MNQFVGVGRLTSDLEVKELENGRKETIMTLAINRSFKNMDGIYETDFIPCKLWNSIAENTCEYCKKGDIVGIKGRLQVDDNKVIVIAEKVTFLSSRKSSEEE